MTTLECLNYQKSSQQVAIVCHCYERLAVLQNFYAIILLLASESVEKRFGETVYKKIKKKRRSRDVKIAFVIWKTPNLAQILEQSSNIFTRQVCDFPFCSLYIKQIDSMLPWVCSVIDHRGRQNVVKTSLNTIKEECSVLDGKKVD